MDVEGKCAFDLIAMIKEVRLRSRINPQTVPNYILYIHIKR